MNPDTAQAPVQLIYDAIFGQHYGAVLTADPRDHALCAYVVVDASRQPVAYYPNLDGIPHWMQAKLGACVGHAAGKARQVMSYNESGASVITPFSARFLYAYAKCIDGNPTIQGSDPRMVARIMRKVGTATEATCPNDTSLDHATYTYNGNLANIPPEAIAEAGKVKISNFAFADLTEAGIKAAIQFAGEHNGGVFVLAETDKNWWTDIQGNITWDASKILPLRPPQDPATLGQHEVMPYAFDEINGRTVIYIFNSWSEAWGDKGNGWFYLDEWMPHIKQVIVAFDIPMVYTALGFTYNFTQSLKLGMSGSDVVALQHLLRIDGEFPENVSLSGYFGPVTQAAVKAFQVKYADEVLTPAGLVQPTGFVGALTLNKLNALSNSKA